MRGEQLIPRPLRSAAFRFALLIAAVVAIGAAGLLLTVEHQVGRYAREASDGMLRTETTVLAGEYEELGLSGLTDAMKRHRGTTADPPYHYLLQDAGRRRLAGDLPDAAAVAGTGVVIVREDVGGGPRHERMSTLGTRLPDGLLLVVGTDSFDVEDLRQRLSRFTLWSGAAIALFALLGGYVVGRAFLRRLERVNRAIDRIVDGDRAERLPMIGFGPEFDELARNLNRMLDRIAAAMEALRQVSTDIAHDLRTPLTRLHQRLERMKSEAVVDFATVDAALSETESLLATFQALLRIGTVEGGVGRQRFTAINLSEVANRVYEAYQPVVEDSGQIFVADHASDVRVTGDAELLAQALTNLIENAIVHTPGGTTITSRLTIRHGAPEIEVCDTGPGIPAAERGKVFRRFYRLDASRSTEGAGLGLALVAAIASLHRADCTIPETEGGLCVRLTFPPLIDQVTGAP
ncbi:two-component sensor histidine kinase [Sphingomonas sp. S-NIH.Pt1_0416]|nr:two-component sensor histidine kinase [Sphingomonas sp. S-NIH.Pt1_0416]